MDKNKEYYFSVWIDFLHDTYQGFFAINLQQVNNKGGVIKTHRKHIPCYTTLPTEKEIVGILLPNAIFIDTKTQMDNRDKDYNDSFK